MEEDPACRARILINRTDPDTGERNDYPPSDPPPKTPMIVEASHAFTLRKNIYDDKDDNDGEIDIASQDLWDLIGQILVHYPNHAFAGPRTQLNSPYESLILNWEKLEEATQQVRKIDKLVLT